MKTKHLEIHDLANVLTLIDGAAKQGMFSGDQLAIIGVMRQKFVSELKEQAPSQDNVSKIVDEEPKIEASSE